MILSTLKGTASRVKSASLVWQYWLSFVAGLAMVFAYAPYSQWWLSFIALTCWGTLVNCQTPKLAAVRSYFFGLGWFGAGISWVHVSIDQFGGLPLIASLGLMALLCAYLALFPALAGYLSARCSTNRQLNLLLFPSIWLLTEWLRAWVLTGFPWLSIGYSQLNSPLAGLAPIIGEVGISFIMLIMVTSALSLYFKQQVKLAGAMLASCVLGIIVSQQLTFVKPTGETKSVALVQGNIAQELKWAQEQEWPSMLKYLDLTRANYDADLIVWPESAIPKIEPLAGEFLDMANSAAALNDTAIITGIINYNFESKEYFNSLIVLGKESATDTSGSYFYPNANRFYKHHLLPIGEFVPFQEWLRPIAPFFNLPMSSFTRGDYIQSNLKANGLSITPLICFEIAFPEQLHANFKADTDMLLTVSNDAWFGTSHGPHQHMEIAQMRALEFGRPLVRSTNTGVTAAVDHQGQFIARIPQFEEQVLKADVALVTGYTPFSRYQRYPTYILATLLFLLIIGVSRKTKL
ncbi:apolipoprotein N-acyltransferase [Thalassotalea euphylliae]|uniref:Apolipoprotein N-acyltransferase n=1 Tax=Thalassotalea euphylliae TaxID=1655234 RepID=A0A3E0UFZ0_9GAMM|nr:apolipoprotein N-acyltransferase [Thalassotalea euphylliae]REL35065.1 apolipoprotein N-acyltransferase [Thalassotalea euphylliae]